MLVIYPFYMNLLYCMYLHYVVNEWVVKITFLKISISAVSF
jgi:hypothetical protein